MINQVKKWNIASTSKAPLVTFLSITLSLLLEITIILTFMIIISLLFSIVLLQACIPKQYIL